MLNRDKLVLMSWITSWGLARGTRLLASVEYVFAENTGRLDIFLRRCIWEANYGSQIWEISNGPWRGAKSSIYGGFGSEVHRTRWRCTNLVDLNRGCQKCISNCFSLFVICMLHHEFSGNYCNLTWTELVAVRPSPRSIIAVWQERQGWQIEPGKTKTRNQKNPPFSFTHTLWKPCGYSFSSSTITRLSIANRSRASNPNRQSSKVASKTREPRIKPTPAY